MTDALSYRNKQEQRHALLTKELERWLPLLIAQEEPERIIVFGSYASGDIDEWSDLDLVVVKEDDAPFLERIRRVLALLRPQVGLDVLVYTPEELAELCASSPFVREEIVNQGRVLYTRGGRS